MRLSLLVRYLCLPLLLPTVACGASRPATQLADQSVIVGRVFVTHRDEAKLHCRLVINDHDCTTFGDDRLAIASGQVGPVRLTKIDCHNDKVSITLKLEGLSVELKAPGEKVYFGDLFIDGPPKLVMSVESHVEEAEAALKWETKRSVQLIERPLDPAGVKITIDEMPNYASIAAGSPGTAAIAMTAGIVQAIKHTCPRPETLQARDR